MKRALEQMTVAVSALVAAAGKLTSHKNHLTGRSAMIALISLAVIGPLAPALAAVAPQITISCTGTNSCTATGTGFTPSGIVLAQAYAGSSAFSSTHITASAPTLVCVTGLKPICHDVGGGSFTAALPADYALMLHAEPLLLHRQSPPPSSAS